MNPGLCTLQHNRRRVVHINVTDAPTAQWTAQQLVEAFPWQTAPRYLLRDRDAVYGVAFSRRAQSMGIHEVKTAARSPWQNPYIERLIGTLRRECLDHVVVLNETHLRRLLSGYLIYYHGARTHLSLEKDTPDPRPVEHLDEAESSRRRWSAASIIATVSERRKLLSAGCPGYIDGAGRCVRLGALEPTPRWLRVEPRWSTLRVRRIRRPTTKGRSRSQGT
jgi:Integrase core domain